MTENVALNVAQEAQIAKSDKQRWNEMSDAERIALLRREVRYLRDLVMAHSKLLDSLLYHEHGSSGAVVVSAVQQRNCLGGERHHDPLA